MVNHMYIITCMCTLLMNASASPWASPAQELLDERNDAEIYSAVVKSMNEYYRRQRRVKRDVQSVCYADVGCFEAAGPFSYLDMLPISPEEMNTRFFLYPSHNKRRSGSSPTEVPFKNLTDAFEWAKHGFNNTLPTKVMIHGFGSDCTHIWVYEMRSALMAVEDLNVICVDWSNGAVLPNYVRATANTRLVGKQLGMLLKGLIERAGLSRRLLHLIGFSLGAHVAGFAGAELGNNLSRITGLDPAGPLFESQDPRARLDQTDAEFVDVIHSNGENLILGGLGSWQPMGHVDFYPNGGRMQKGCSNIFVGAVSDIIWSSAIEGRSLCNHRRAYKFFTDSVSPRCHFPAFPCESYDDFLAGKCFPCTDERKCGNMGYYADRSKGRGQLYLITRDEEPFCAHQYHIKIESTATETPIVSYGKIQITLIGDSLLNETFTLTRKEDEEMKLGASVARIIVPHPILLEPTKIQILYNAYSGWLTSGLLQWRIDKITLSDSFGRSSSVCQKNLILDSGIPVVLPLYPGECNLPNKDSKPIASDRIDEKSKNETHQSKFVPTPVVKIGSEIINKKYDQDRNNLFKDALDILNLPWNENNNIVDGETEQSRAFNTRVVKMTRADQRNNGTEKPTSIIEREVVEPILKPHSAKIGRSHDPTRDKPEITEPILGPTTVRTGTTTTQPNIISRLTNNNNKELVYNFYESDKDMDWVPAVNPTLKTTEQKWKRQDDSQTILNNDNNINNKDSNSVKPTNSDIINDNNKSNDKNNNANGNNNVNNNNNVNSNNNINVNGKNNANTKNSNNDINTVSNNNFNTRKPNNNNNNSNREDGDPFNAILKTVQFIPHRLARMFEEAEKYARETLLPFVSTYTPKFLSDIITPRDQVTPKYLPLKFEENTEKIFQTTARLFKAETKAAVQNARSFDPPPLIPTSELTEEDIKTTPYTHIQKIAKKLEKVTLVYPSDVEVTTVLEDVVSTSSSVSSSSSSSTSTTASSITVDSKINVTSTVQTVPTKKDIYINLPVDDSSKEIKYIPLEREGDKGKKSR